MFTMRHPPRRTPIPFRLATWVGFVGSLAFLIVASLALVAALPSVALAETRLELLSRELRTSDDYRVRVQAAAGLGALSDEGAVKPLCGGLADANATVRTAAAAGLAKLGKPGGVKCLEDASKTEKDTSAKAQILRSLDALKPGVPMPAAPTAASKYYVTLEITNKSSRKADDVDTIVRGAIQARVLAKKEFAMAAKSEAATVSAKVAADKKLKAFHLLVTVEAPEYKSNTLVQRLQVAMLSMPGKVLKGEVKPKLTQSDTSKVDPASEVELIKLCSESAADGFLKVAPTL